MRRAHVALTALASVAIASSALAQGSGWHFDIAPTFVSHVQGPQAKPLTTLGDGSVAGTLGVEGMLSRSGGFPLGLRVGFSTSDIENTFITQQISGDNLMLRAQLLTHRMLDQGGRFRFDIGAGLMHSVTEANIPQAGVAAGLYGARGKIKTTETAPLIGTGLTWNVLRSGPVRAGVRVGAEMAFTQDQSTVVVPIGIQIGR